MRFTGKLWYSWCTLTVTMGGLGGMVGLASRGMVGLASWGGKAPLSIDENKIWHAVTTGTRWVGLRRTVTVELAILDAALVVDVDLYGSLNNDEEDCVNDEDH